MHEYTYKPYQFYLNQDKYLPINVASACLITPNYICYSEKDYVSNFFLGEKSPRKFKNFCKLGSN